ncbi:MAG: hypothetical protein IJ515_04065 [Clostridia bacterium]|nr:hypothetical protein [Clostridia bacterium]
MASRFVTFANDGEADYIVDGVGLKYVELSDEEASKVMESATEYKVQKIEIERYSHEEYGDYETVEKAINYEINEVKSLSEKIWKKKEGACDVIVGDGIFLGVVFFTGFTDYRGLEEFGFVPIEHIDSREGLTDYTSQNISILLCKASDLPQSTRSTTEQYTLSGRATTSYRTNFYLIKK